MQANLRVGLGLAILLVAWPGNSHAYLDAGTGSMILQAAVAAVAGAGFFLKLYWGKLRAFLSRRPADSAPVSPPEE
ncbi:MAG: hypothetical protein GY719_19725 [bacterium]|nr:hypothetical protein [bacterium]